MKHPRKAIVLAAGYGARLLPLTLLKPKPLFPLWGKPALQHALDLLRRWGVRDVLVNTHHHAGQILDYLRDNPIPGVRCQISFEPEILGTGGVLPKARWFLGDEPFWMLNADVLADLPSAPLLQAHQRQNAIATLWLHPERGPRTVEYRNGLVTVFKSAMAGTEGTATFCGLQLLSPRILNFLPPSGFASIVDAYENAMIAGEKIAGVTVPNAYWADIGKPETYLATHREMLERPRWKHLKKTNRGGAFAAGKNTSVPASASVTGSVLWDNVSVVPGARIDDAIVADGTVVRGHVSYMAMRADQLSDPVITRILGGLGWDPASTTVQPLPPRGSARTFTRLTLAHTDKSFIATSWSGAASRAVRSRKRLRSERQEDTSSAIVVHYSLERPENALYTSHARFLAKHGVHVPSVLLDWKKEQICVLEDVGENSLEQLAPHLDRQHCVALYKQTLDTVARLHVQATRAAMCHPLKLSIPFTRHLYEWEQNLFCDQFLQRHRSLDAEQMATIRKELAGLIPAQVRAPRVIIHRDLQSSNVLVKDGHVFLIDFQGMRLGTAAYDLASLLCDPYVNLPEDVRAELLDYYLGLIPNGKVVGDLFWIASVERLSQALGAFGRLGAVPATAYFLKHIPAGVKQLRNALDHVPGLPMLTECIT